jgi:hypothetical protein
MLAIEAVSALVAGAPFARIVQKAANKKARMGKVETVRGKILIGALARI